MYIPPQVEVGKMLVKRDTSDGSPAEIPVFAARPKDDQKAARPVLLLFQEAFGVNNHIQDVCQRYARQGYVVVSPDMYYRGGHWQSFGYTDFEATAKARELLTEDLIVGDVRAALDYIASMDGVDADRIGVLGYCMGGRLAYVTACHFSDRIRAAAVYYGGGLTQQSAQFPVPPVERTNQIKVPLIGFFGGEDKGIPKSMVEKVEQALQAANVYREIYFYPEAGHGFFCNERASFNPVASQDAWHRTLQWFADKIGPVPSVDWRE